MDVFRLCSIFVASRRFNDDDGNRLAIFFVIASPAGYALAFDMLSHDFRDRNMGKWLPTSITDILADPRFIKVGLDINRCVGDELRELHVTGTLEPNNIYVSLISNFSEEEADEMRQVTHSKASALGKMTMLMYNYDAGLFFNEQEYARVWGDRVPPWRKSSDEEHVWPANWTPAVTYYDPAAKQQWRSHLYNCEMMPLVLIAWSVAQCRTKYLKWEGWTLKTIVQSLFSAETVRRQGPLRNQVCKPRLDILETRLQGERRVQMERQSNKDK